MYKKKSLHFLRKDIEESGHKVWTMLKAITCGQCEKSLICKKQATEAVYENGKLSSAELGQGT